MGRGRGGPGPGQGGAGQSRRGASRLSPRGAGRVKSAGWRSVGLEGGACQTCGMPRQPTEPGSKREANNNENNNSTDTAARQWRSCKVNLIPAGVTLGEGGAVRRRGEGEG